MQYSEVLDYMYRQLPMYQRQGSIAFKKDLTNISGLAEHLGNPQDKFSSIHIAGTNGKGTVAHIIAGVLQAHGLKVGMYTSPHYIDFRERIKINGSFISEDEVVDFISKNIPVFEKIKPSFFEMTVAMAFDYFAIQKVDIAIIETGLGGRLDSTNIITPQLSVITNISFDHQAMLGSTLPLIASEKAGIIKNGVPVVVGESQDEVNHVFVSKAIETSSSINFADCEASLTKSDTGLTISINEKKWITDIDTELSSSFQRKNLRTALYSLYKLRKRYNLNEEKVRVGIKTLAIETHYIGRWQKLGVAPIIIVDSAHNVAGVQELFNNISDLTYDHLHIVMGMVNDKDLTDVLKLLPNKATYYFAKANIPRGLHAQKLKETASYYKLEGSSYKTVTEAYSEAKSIAGVKDLILVMGSVFVVAEVLRFTS